MAPKTGSRVQIDVKADINKDQCAALIEKYSSDGEPDGQVGVNKPSKKLGGKNLPFCVKNFDGDGIRFNDVFFE